MYGSDVDDPVGTEEDSVDDERTELVNGLDETVFSGVEETVVVVVPNDTVFDIVCEFVAKDEVIEESVGVRVDD